MKWGRAGIMAPQPQRPGLPWTRGLAQSPVGAAGEGPVLKGWPLEHLPSEGHVSRVHGTRSKVKIKQKGFHGVQYIQLKDLVFILRFCHAFCL